MDAGAGSGPLEVVGSKAGHLWDALCRAYDSLGFDKATGGDEVFRALVLTRIIDLGMGLQEAVDAPRFRYVSGNRVMMEQGIGQEVIDALVKRGDERVTPRGPIRSHMGGAQLIMIDPENGSLMGASDPRKDGMALGW